MILDRVIWPQNDIGGVISTRGNTFFLTVATVGGKKLARFWKNCQIFFSRHAVSRKKGVAVF